MVRVEHLVVGGGATGLTVAWRLAAQGRQVLVLEREAVAAGASGGPGERGVRANGRDPRELALMERAYRIWPGLAAEIGRPTGYRRTGQLHLAERPEDLPALAAQAAAQESAGVPSAVLEGPELFELEPELSGAVVAAVHCPLDGVADHTATTMGLAAAARRAGAELREGWAVVRLVRSGMGVDAIAGDGDGDGDGDGELIGARTVVLAANGATQTLLGSIGVSLPVFPVYPQVLLTGRLAQSPVRRLIGHAHRPVALKTLPGGEVMITGGRLGRWDAGAGRAVVDPDQVAANLADAAAVYPSLAGVEAEVAVADRAEAVSHDLVPIVDRVPGTGAPGGAFLATGWSGHGWAIAPVVAELVVEWITTGRRPSLLSPFALARFGSG